MDQIYLEGSPGFLVGLKAKLTIQALGVLDPYRWFHLCKDLATVTTPVLADLRVTNYNEISL